MRRVEISSIGGSLLGSPPASTIVDLDDKHCERSAGKRLRPAGMGMIALRERADLESIGRHFWLRDSEPCMNPSRGFIPLDYQKLPFTGLGENVRFLAII
jgi:hypothetical protein